MKQGTHAYHNITTVEAIVSFPLPTSFKQLQAFLGLVNFYHRFVPAAAKILKPLMDVLRGGQKGAKPVPWTAEMRQSFKAAKTAVATASSLAHPIQGAFLSLAVDASASHVGAVLQQQFPRGSAWWPLGFFLRKLEPAQVRYSAFDRELLACYCCLDLLHYYSCSSLDFFHSSGQAGFPPFLLSATDHSGAWV
jgi:hypothetical protein